MCVFKNHAFIYFLRPPSWSGTLSVPLLSHSLSHCLTIPYPQCSIDPTDLWSHCFTVPYAHWPTESLPSSVPAVLPLQAPSVPQPHCPMFPLSHCLTAPCHHCHTASLPMSWWTHCLMACFQCSIASLCYVYPQASHYRTALCPHRFNASLPMPFCPTTSLVYIPLRPTASLPHVPTIPLPHNFIFLPTVPLPHSPISSLSPCITVPTVSLVSHCLTLKLLQWLITWHFSSQNRDKILLTSKFYIWNKINLHLQFQKQNVRIFFLSPRTKIRIISINIYISGRTKHLQHAWSSRCVEG